MQNISLKQELLDFLEGELDVPLEEPPPHPDSEIAKRMQRIQWDLTSRVGNSEKFSEQLGHIIRSAIDYVIDAPTLHRYSIQEIDPDEKTAIGKRIERLMKYEFNLPKGTILDVVLANEEVDIKTTMGKNWMFSKSSHGKINLLIAYDESKATYRLGLAYVEEDQLGAQNRDRKQSLTAEHKANIFWIFKDIPYPPNFLAGLPKDHFKKIISHKTGMKRVIELLRLTNRKAIPRHVICSVANQKDPMRRIRSNGGARDLLWEEGILVLSGAYECDRHVAKNSTRIMLEDDEMLTIHLEDHSLTEDLCDYYRKEHNLTLPN